VILDLDKTLLLEQRHEIPNRDGTAYSTRPGFQIVRHLCRQSFLQDNIGKL